jgi:hypothetical protein
MTRRDAVDRLIDRQEAFTTGLTDREFLAHLGPTLELLNRPGSAAEILVELRDEQRRQAVAFSDAQRTARIRLERWAERFESTDARGRLIFEEIRGRIQRAEPIEQGIGPEGTPAPATPVRESLNALDRAACDAVGEGWLVSGALEGFRGDMYEYGHAERDHAIRLQTGAEFALERLEMVAAHVNPPDHATYSAGQIPRALGIGGVFDRLVFGGEADVENGVVAVLLQATRADLQRLFLELRRRLDVTRSRLATVRRFATWASWYGRDELRELVDNADTRHIEDVLTGRLARFLFDHGHTPISKPLLGRVEPDLLDPSALEPLYVEAKQYARPSNAIRTVAQGVRQTADTASLLAGTELALEEAFVVVFVRDGPRLDVPPFVRVANLTIHLVVVDLVEWERVGSRRRENPLVASENDLLAAVDEVQTTQARASP